MLQFSTTKPGSFCIEKFFFCFVQVVLGFEKVDLNQTGATVVQYAGVFSGIFGFCPRQDNPMHSAFKICGKKQEVGKEIIRRSCVSATRGHGARNARDIVQISCIGTKISFSPMQFALPSKAHVWTPSKSSVHATSGMQTRPWGLGKMGKFHFLSRAALWSHVHVSCHCCCHHCGPLPTP